MTDKATEEAPASFEETRAELLASLERAHELVSDARQLIRPKGKTEPEPQTPPA